MEDPARAKGGPTPDEAIAADRDRENAVGSGPEDDEQSHEPADPHPDTPDDFDEAIESGRDSVEAVPED